MPSTVLKNRSFYILSLSLSTCQVLSKIEGVMSVKILHGPLIKDGIIVRYFQSLEIQRLLGTHPSTQQKHLPSVALCVIWFIKNHPICVRILNI
jgi:hypothetical protein